VGPHRVVPVRAGMPTAPSGPIHRARAWLPHRHSRRLPGGFPRYLDRRALPV